MNREPTNKQKAVVEKLIVDKCSSKADIMRSVGYSEAVAIKPSIVINSQGVQKLIAEAGQIEGLSDSNVLRVIEKAIQDRDYKQGAQTALKWLQLKYTTQNRFTENKSVTINNPNPEAIDEQTHKYICQKYDIPHNRIRAYLRAFNGKDDQHISTELNNQSDATEGQTEGTPAEGSLGVENK